MTMNSIHPISPARTESPYATLYTLTMEDAEAVLRELGHDPSSEQLDEMEHDIRKGVEFGLGDAWHDVMRTACEIAWGELHT